MIWAVSSETEITKYNYVQFVIPVDNVFIYDRLKQTHTLVMLLYTDKF